MNIMVCQYADMTSPRFSMAATKYEHYFQFSLHGNRIDKNDLTMNGFQSENNIKIMELSFKTPCPRPPAHQSSAVICGVSEFYCGYFINESTGGCIKSNKRTEDQISVTLLRICDSFPLSSVPSFSFAHGLALVLQLLPEVLEW